MNGSVRGNIDLVEILSLPEVFDFTEKAILYTVFPLTKLNL